MTMRQIVLIASKELRAAVRTPRFVLALLVILPVLTGVALINYHDFTLRLQAYEVSLQQQADGFTAVKDYWRLLRSFITAFRPPNPKAMIASGVMRNLDETFFMFNVNNAPDRRSLLVRNSVARVYSHWDMAGIGVIIISLLSLVLAHDAFCGEKMYGTSQLLFSAPIRGSTIVIGKILGIFLTISIPIVLATLIATMAGFALIPGVMGMLTVGLVAYAGMAMALALAFVCLGVTISLLVYRPLNALALSLVFWLALVFIAPQLSTTIASAAHPAPGQAEIDERSQTLVNDYLAAFQRFTLEDTPDSRIAFRRYWFGITREYQEKLRGLSGEINNRVRLQERMVNNLAWSSPAFAWSVSLTQFCRTNPVAELETEEDVWRALIVYISHVEKMLMPDLELSLRTGQPIRQYAAGIDWAAIPRPRIAAAVEPFRGEALLHGLLVCLVWAGSLVVISLLLVRRFDPR